MARVDEGVFGQYVGLPFADKGRDRCGVDCWGLIRLVYREVLAIDLPSYADAYAPLDEREADDLRRLIETGASAWLPVALEDAEQFDCLALTAAGEPHVGCVVRKGAMLHVQIGRDTVIEPYTGPLWRRRILGCFRHVERDC